jgi:hypothetical protein
MWVHRVTTFGAVRGPVLVAMAGVTVLLAAGCSQGASPAQVAHAEQVAVQAQVRKDATKQQQNAAASQKAHAVALKDEAAKAAAEKAAAEKAAAAKVAEVKAATAQAAAAKAAEAQAPVPTLGQIGGEATSDGQGFGLVRPSTVFNGGDPSGLLANVVWGSWGGPTAVGTGISDYSAPNQSVAGGTQLPATIVAFNLGTCDGKLMYQALEWYFPERGQVFDPTQYENICTGPGL